MLVKIVKSSLAQSKTAISHFHDRARKDVHFQTTA